MPTTPKTTAADEPAPVTAVDDLAARRDNYSTFIARETIFVGGARAYNVGDPVSTSSVDDGSIDRGLVVLRDSDEGKRILES